MTPEQFLAQLQRQGLAPAYLFLGSEPYRLGQCRQSLVERMLPAGDRDEGLTRHDLAESSLSAVLDDARSMSLFATRRLVWASNAESALPRMRGGAGDGRAADAGDGAHSLLLEYLKSPLPDVAVVFEASRYDLEGEDKAKVDRVRKFYAAIPAVVEFPRFAIQDARRLAQELVRKAELRMERPEVDLLVESLGGDAMKIASEIDKLRLYAGPDRTIRAQDLAALVPDSSAATVFVLVDAIGRGDRVRALGLLNTLIRQGEYLPLALSFLAGLFRLALVAKEQGMRSAQQVQDRLSRPGRPIWRSRAEQILHASTLFSKRQLETVLRRIYETDKALRDARPDDRIVMERFILRLAE